MSFAVVLAREGFAAYGADKGSFVCVCAEVGAEVVGSGEAFWTQGALEGSGVFLDSFWFAWCCAGTLGVGEIEDVVSVLD